MQNKCMFKEVNLLFCIVQHRYVLLFIRYEMIHKNANYSEIETKKVKIKFFIRENEHFYNLIRKVSSNKVFFD